MIEEFRSGKVFSSGGGDGSQPIAPPKKLSIKIAGGLKSKLRTPPASPASNRAKIPEHPNN